MKEQDLIDAGFERVDITAEDSGDKKFHYYSYDFGNHAFSLITPANDEVSDGVWFAEVFEDDSIRFYDIEDVLTLISVINKNTKNEV